MLRRAVRYKEPSMVGKLSSPRLPPPEQSSTAEKQVSAFLQPAVTQPPAFTIRKQHRGSRTFWSSGRGADTDEPLPRIPHSHYSVTEHQRIHQAPNPQQSVFFVDGRKGRVSRCIATQVKEKKTISGQLRQHRVKSLGIPGRIRHQRPIHLNRSFGQQSRLKDFLQHQYVKDQQHSPSPTRCLMVSSHRWEEGASVDSSWKNSQVSERISAERQNLLPVCFEETYDLSRLGSRVLLRQDQHLGFFQDRLKDQENDSPALSFLENQNQCQGVSVNEQYHSFYRDESSGDAVEIGFEGLSRVKQLLIEQESGLRVSFNLPAILTSPPSKSIVQPQIHDAAHKVFSYFFNFKPQLVSMRRFKNCLLVSTVHKCSNSLESRQRLAMLWYYSGRFYVGGWSEDQGGQFEGHRSGIGMEFIPKGFVYYGEFKNNCRKGYGIMKKANCQVYVGEWSEGRRNGWGKVFGPGTALLMDGTFRSGRFSCPRLPAE